MGQRDLNIFALYGQQKNTGAVDAPLFPTNGIELLIAGLGNDGGNSAISSNTAGSGYGITGATGSGTSTITAASTVGQTSFTVGASGVFTVGQYVQIDVNTPATPTTAEVRKCITGTTGTTVVVDHGISFTHASGVAIKGVVAPFTHSILEANVLPSITIEKNVGSWESLQFAGSRVNKLDLKIATTDTEAALTADVIAQKVAVLSSPSPISIIDEMPFVFAEANLTYGGTQLLQATNFEISIDNGLKPTYSFNSEHYLQFLTPVTRKVSGKFEAVFYSFDDATYGYEGLLMAGTQNSLTFSLTHNGPAPISPATGDAGKLVTITLPQVNLSKYADDVKMEDVVMSSLDYEASLALSAATPSTISATIVNANWLPY